MHMIIVNPASSGSGYYNMDLPHQWKECAAKLVAWGAINLKPKPKGTRNRELLKVLQ